MLLGCQQYGPGDLWFRGRKSPPLVLTWTLCPAYRLSHQPYYLRCLLPSPFLHYCLSLPVPHIHLLRPINPAPRFRIPVYPLKRLLCHQVTPRPSNLPHFGVTLLQGQSFLHWISRFTGITWRAARVRNSFPRYPDASELSNVRNNLHVLPVYPLTYSDPHDFYLQRFSDFAVKNYAHGHRARGN